MSVKAAATQVAKKIDWETVAKVIVTDEGKRELTSLRRTYDEVNQTLDSKMNLKEVNIDWAFYKEKLNPDIVNILEKSYKSLEIPDYVDKFTPEFEKKHQELVAQATEAENFSKKELVRLGKELEESKAQREALRTQTVDDYFEKNPSMKKEIDEELAHQNWGY